MMIRSLTRIATLGTAVILSLSASSAFADNVNVSILPHGVETPGVTPYYTTFDGFTGGTYTTNFGGSPITGTYTSTYPGGGVNQGQAAPGVSIYPADLYGGAGGTGSYLVTQYLSETTLSLSGPNNGEVNYFGLWFSALDSGNVLTFLNNGVQVFQFNQSDYIALSGGCPGASGYCGNPSGAFAGQDPNEQFAYFNFTDTTGTFNEVVFSQIAGNAYGRFEADNNAVANVASTPEPSSLILLGTGLVGMAGAVRRRFSK